MDTAWLEDFVTLAETGNFTRAAARRNVSQAAFSRRIRQLEDWLGTRLVDRGVVPVALTAEGQLFQREASETLSRLSETRNRLGGPFPGRDTKVTIALPHALAAARFTGWWAGWSRETGVSAATRIANVNEVISRFISGSVDFLICHRAEQLPVLLDPQLFVSHTIEQDRLIPGVARGYAGGRENPTGTPDDPVPLLMYSKDAYFGRLVEAIIEQAPFRVYGVRRIESEMAQVIRSGIAAGLGMGWIPQCILKGRWNERVRPVTIEGLSMDLSIVAFAHRKRKAAADVIWQRICAENGAGTPSAAP